MKILLLSAAIGLLLSFSPNNNPLAGRWSTKPSNKGNVTSVEFRSDSTFDGFINRKAFVSGTYTLQDSIFSFVDNGCEGKRGVYKTIFFSYGDSLRFEPISDSCLDRRAGMSVLVLGKIKD